MIAGRAVLILTAYIALAMSAVGFLVWKQASYPPVPVVESVRATPVLQGSALNAAVYDLIRSGESERVYRFVDGFTRSRDVSFAIVANALSYSVPLDDLVALAEVESQMNPEAVSPHDGDGSTDLGLMQLNSGTYASYSRAYLLDLGNNVRMGTAHLADGHSKYGDWIEAMVAYNAGTIDEIAADGIKRIAAIVEERETFDAKASEAL